MKCKRCGYERMRRAVFCAYCWPMDGDENEHFVPLNDRNYKSDKTYFACNEPANFWLNAGCDGHRSHDSRYASITGKSIKDIWLPEGSSYAVALHNRVAFVDGGCVHLFQDRGSGFRVEDSIARNLKKDMVPVVMPPWLYLLPYGYSGAAERVNIAAVDSDDFNELKNNTLWKPLEIAVGVARDTFAAADLSSRTIVFVDTKGGITRISEAHGPGSDLYVDRLIESQQAVFSPAIDAKGQVWSLANDDTSGVTLRRNEMVLYRNETLYAESAPRLIDENGKLQAEFWASERSGEYCLYRTYDNEIKKHESSPDNNPPKLGQWPSSQSHPLAALVRSVFGMDYYRLVPSGTN